MTFACIWLCCVNLAAFILYGAKRAVLRAAGRLALISGGALGASLSASFIRRGRRKDIPLPFCLIWLIVQAVLFWMIGIEPVVLPDALLLFLAVINVIAFIGYGADKGKAMMHAWCIRESLLLILAAAGGSLGAFSAMTLFRHKISDTRFFITVPILLIIHLALIGWLFS